MRLTVCPTLNLWVRIIIANTPSVAFRNTLVAGFADISLGRIGPLAQPPKLETLLFDSRLDHVAGQVVGRAAVGRDGADRTPGGELLRQLAASQIASKRSEAEDLPRT